MSYYIVKVHSLFYKADNSVLPTSYTGDNESAAREAARYLNRNPQNITTRIEDYAFVAAVHHVIEAVNYDEAISIARAMPRPMQPTITL